jgi:DNA-binding PadR family transcriptional regulator
VVLGHEIRHGYAIMQRFAEETGGHEVLLPGTLYSSIARMLDDRLIEEVAPPTGEEGDARRRFYRATARGLALAGAEAERLERLVDMARRQSLLPESTR